MAITMRGTAPPPTRPRPVNEPWRYQRRIDTLGMCSRRDAMFRTDWLEAVRGTPLSIGALAVALVLADASTRFGADVKYLTQAEIAARCNKRNGTVFQARWAKRGLDELRDAGLLDWDHGTILERNDQARRQRLGGRWQGPCIYRMVIPAEWVARIAERRRQARANKTHGRAQRSPREQRRDEARQRALNAAAEAARLAASYKEALAVLEAQSLLTDPELWNLAIEELDTTWAALHPPGN